MDLWRTSPTLRGATYGVLALAPFWAPIAYSIATAPPPPQVVSVDGMDFTVATACSWPSPWTRLNQLGSFAAPLALSAFLFAFARATTISGLLLFGLALLPWALGLFATYAGYLTAFEMIPKSGSARLEAVSAELADANGNRMLGAATSAGLLLAIAAAICGERLAVGRPFARLGASSGHWPLLGATIAALTCALLCGSSALSGSLATSYLSEMARNGTDAALEGRAIWERASTGADLAVTAILLLGALAMGRLLEKRARFVGLAIWALALPLLALDRGADEVLRRSEHLAVAAGDPHVPWPWSAARSVAVPRAPRSAAF